MADKVIVLDNEPSGISKFFTRFPWFLVLGLTITIALMSIFPKVEYITETRLNDTTIYRTKDTTIYKWKDSIIYKDTNFYITKEVVDTFYKDVDTLGILKDWYIERTYEDTLSNDSILFATAEYVVFKNRLTRRDFTYRISERTNVKTILIEQPENSIWLGAEIGGNLNTFSFSPRISYQDNNDNKFGYSYDLIGGIHKLSYERKFDLKKIRWLQH